MKRIANAGRRGRTKQQIRARSSNLDSLSLSGFGRAARSDSSDSAENSNVISTKEIRSLNSMGLESFGRNSRGLDPLRGQTFGASKRGLTEAISPDYPMLIMKPLFDERLNSISRPASFYLRALTTPFFNSRIQ